AWEREAQKCSEHGVRVVLARFGLILDSEQGALPKMAMPYKFGAGGTLGSGDQWYSWIHIDDLMNALLFAGVNKDIKGPVNMTAPMPHRQKYFSVYLSSALGRPNFVKIPGFLIEKVLGEQYMLILKGQYVMPEVLMEQDFIFISQTLKIAVVDLVVEEKACKSYYSAACKNKLVAYWTVDVQMRWFFMMASKCDGLALFQLFCDFIELSQPVVDTRL